SCRFLLYFIHLATATAHVCSLSLHDALPIFRRAPLGEPAGRNGQGHQRAPEQTQNGTPNPSTPPTPFAHHNPSPVLHKYGAPMGDRKSTRLNSSHVKISYAVFCLKKKIIINI